MKSFSSHRSLDQYNMRKLSGLVKYYKNVSQITS